MTRSGELEAAVMSTVWDAAAPVTVRQVRETLRPQRDLAYTTVMTVMDRLCHKGMLVRTQSGRAFAYVAHVSRSDYAAQVMTDALHTSDDRAAALMHFAGQLPARDRKALRAALEGSGPTAP